MLLSDLEDRLTAREYVGWQLYYESHPPDWERLQLAVLCMLVNNAWFKRKRDVERFLPKRRGARLSAEQIEAEMMAFARKYNARQKEKGA